MFDFQFYNPTKIIYGCNRIKDVGKYVCDYSKSRMVLLVVSQSSKSNGILDAVINSLQEYKISFEILDGIVSNPVLNKVYEGKEICLKNDIDFILAVGGASVVDTAKTIAVAASNDVDIWELIENSKKIDSALPLGVVITLYGSGTEMTNGAVISNLSIPKKRGYDSNYMYPKFSILDPTTLNSVSKRYLQIGMTDMFSHVLEEYFEITNNDNLSDSYLELLARQMISEFKLSGDRNYDHSRLMWLSTLAQNKFFAFDRELGGEWCAHIIAHEFCMKYNFSHGEVVSILLISWLQFIAEGNKYRLIKFGKNVFGLNSNNPFDTIIEIQKIFILLKNRSSLKEMGVSEEDIDDLSMRCLTGKKLGKYKNLNLSDVQEIIIGGFYGQINSK